MRDCVIKGKMPELPANCGKLGRPVYVRKIPYSVVLSSVLFISTEKSN